MTESMRSLALTLTAGVLAFGCGGGRDDNPFGTGATEPGDEGPSTGASGADQGEGPDDSADSGGGPVFDTPDGGPGGDCDCGSTEWSQIWVADHEAGFVSKMDTRTMIELGRYLTRPDGDGDPSRTSVSLSGRAVAVANRYGGVVKIWADEKFCEDQNGVAGIQTSSGKSDILPWGQDDCIAWYTAFPEHTTQRPVAWAPGKINAGSCKYEDESIWTAGCGGGSPGMAGGEGGIYVHRLDGDDGAVLDTVYLEDFPCESYGPYGGAVEADGSFWVMAMHGYLARVDRETLEFQVYPVPRPELMPYGILVDSKDRPWVTSYSVWSSPRPAWGAGRFDAATETWAFVQEEFASQAGLSESLDGKIWIGTNNLDDWGSVNNGGSPGSRPTGIMWIDRETLQVGQHFSLPVWPKGVAFDKDGFLWSVGWSTALFDSTHHALKIDANTGSYDSYTGIEKPYTYSDMTGWGVHNNACKPEG